MKRIAVFFINLYKLFFSKFLVLLFGKGCRFTPTCSDYSQEAIGRFGLMKGSILSVKRIVRCNPFVESFYFDPVPEKG